MNPEIEELTNGILSKVMNMEINIDPIADEELHMDILQHYRDRFKLFVWDNCPAAITAYMNKAQLNGNLNTKTKLFVMAAGIQAMDDCGKKKISDT